jgi:hypothetical protein
MKRYFVYAGMLGSIDNNQITRRQGLGDVGYWFDIFDTDLKLFLTEDELKDCEEFTQKEVFTRRLKGKN